MSEVSLTFSFRGSRNRTHQLAFYRAPKSQNAWGVLTTHPPSEGSGTRTKPIASESTIALSPEVARRRNRPRQVEYGIGELIYLGAKADIPRVLPPEKMSNWYISRDLVSRPNPQNFPGEICNHMISDGPHLDCCRFSSSLPLVPERDHSPGYDASRQGRSANL